MSLDAVVDLLACPHCAVAAGAGTSGRSAAPPATPSTSPGRATSTCPGRPRRPTPTPRPWSRPGAASSASGRYRAISEALAALLPAGSRTLVDCGAGPGPPPGRVGGGRRRPTRAGAGRVGAGLPGGGPRPPGGGGRGGRHLGADTRPGPAVDAVLCVFAPRNAGEFARILGPGGRLLVVTPMPDHLGELRAALSLMEVAADKPDRLAAALDGPFRAEESVDVRRASELGRGHGDGGGGDGPERLPPGARRDRAPGRGCPVAAVGHPRLPGEPLGARHRVRLSADPGRLRRRYRSANWVAYSSA